jgi:hypothetical protein
MAHKYVLLLIPIVACLVWVYGIYVLAQACSIVPMLFRDFLRWRDSLKQVPLSPEAKKALEEGIQSVKDNPKGIYLGSFSKYKDDD